MKIDNWLEFSINTVSCVYSNYSDDGDFEGEKNHDLDFCMVKKIVISFFFHG